MKTPIKYILVFLMLLGGLSANAVTFPEPKGKQLVHDYIDFFSPADQQQLNQKLVDFANQSSNQIALVVVGDLQGMDRADYAIQLANEWQIGQQNEDNGVLILLKPVGEAGTRHAFIAIGEGLEGVIPDAIANRIVNNEMIPYFKQDKYKQGVVAAVDVLTSLAIQEYNSDQYMEKTNGEPIPVAAIVLILGSLLFMFLIPARNAYSYSRRHDMAYWAAFWLLMGSGNNSSYGSGGSHHGGGFWGGGSSGFGGGGGFGGFGGGSFGGGGAGGSW